MSNYPTWVKAIWITARGDPLRFDNRKYLQQVYTDQHPSIVYMKSSQMGLSERVISEAVWVAEQLGLNVLYTFPSMAQLQDFVQARLDPVIMASEYLWSRTETGDSKQVLKVGLKRFGKGHVYLRGSQNEKQIISVDADMVILDERDRFDSDNVPYIDKRLLASRLKWRREVSTPTLPNMGIHGAYLESDQRVWQLQCDKCKTWQELDFFTNVDFEKKEVVCKKCKTTIDRLKSGRWHITKPENTEVHGYKINGLYNPMRTIPELIAEYEKAKFEGFSSLQQFYNQVLGYPYEISGQSLTNSEIDACIKNYHLPYEESFKETYVGCDVGVDYLHVVVLLKLGEDRMRLIWANTVKKFFGPYDSLEAVIEKFKARYVVIDKKPETSQVRKMVEMFPGRIYAATYPNMKFDVKVYYVYDDIKYEVRIDRTVALDYLVSDIQNQRIELPSNIGMVDGFYDQLMAQVRVTERNKRTGVDSARWVEKGADHFLHTLNYARIAQIRGQVAKALLDYYVTPEKGLTPSFIDWIRVNGRRYTTK